MEATQRLVVSCVLVSPQDLHWCSRKAYILMAVSVVNTPIITSLGRSGGSSRPTWNVKRTYALRVTCRIHSNRVIIAQYNCKRMNKLENLFLVGLPLTHFVAWANHYYSLILLSYLFKEEKNNVFKSILKFLWKEVCRCKVLLFFLLLLLLAFGYDLVLCYVVHRCFSGSHWWITKYFHVILFHCTDNSLAHLCFNPKICVQNRSH